MLKNQKSKTRVLNLILLVCLVGCRKTDRAEKIKEKSIESVMPVKTAVVKRGTVQEVLSFSGDIKGRNEAKIYTRVSGKLTKRLKEEGDYVNKDEVLALVDRDEPAMNFSQVEIKSPISGVIVKYFVDLGEDVFSAQPLPQEPVAVVADIDTVKVLIYVGEEDISKIKKGQKAGLKIDTYADRYFKGWISKIASSLDPLARKLVVEIEVENFQHLLKPGMFARVELVTQTRSGVLVVPPQAVLEKGITGVAGGLAQKTVFVVDANGQAKKTEVLTGLRQDDLVEIVKGLKEGEPVIVEGNYGLVEGTKVEERR